MKSHASIPVRLGLAGLLALAGCADGDIDNPDNSQSLLRIESVEPSLVEADVVKVVVPLTAETVDVTVTSILRSSGTSQYADLTINRVNILYTPPLSTGTGSLVYNTTLPVPAGGTTTIQDFVVVSVSDLIAGITPGTSTLATILVEAEDLLGKPANDTAQLTIQFDDFLDNNDADGDGIDDSLDPAPTDPCNPTPCPP
jgi:hypothetical protein